MTTTTVFGWNLPDIGSDDNSWGAILNATLQDIEDKIVEMRIPVDGLYLSTSAADPATSLGYGTWSAYAAGRALVGVGNNGESTWTGGQTQGSETHTLTTAQMPSHTHGIGSLALGAGGGHTHTASASTSGAHNHRARGEASGAIAILGNQTAAIAGISGGPGAFTNDNSGNLHIESAGSHTHTITVDSVAAHTHSVSGSLDSAGSGAAHNNIQPSIGVYVWRRTA